MYNYLLSNPCHFSSIMLIFVLPVTIYCNNNILLVTEIPLSLTTIIYHNKIKCNENIRIIDISVGQLAYWQHVIYAVNNNNIASITCYFVCPIIFSISKYYERKGEMYLSNLIHSFIHYFLLLGTLFINLTTPKASGLFMSA